MILEIESAYMAGVADSDGSFTISKRKAKSTIAGYFYATAFQLTWKQSEASLKALEGMKAKYGGGIYKTIKNQGFKPGGEFFQYNVHSLQLVGLIKDILPYLKLKKDQAALILELNKSRQKWMKNRKGKGSAKPLELWKFEDDLYEKIFALKGHKRRESFIRS